MGLHVYADWYRMYRVHKFLKLALDRVFLTRTQFDIKVNVFTQWCHTTHEASMVIKLK